MVVLDLNSPIKHAGVIQVMLVTLKLNIFAGQNIRVPTFGPYAASLRICDIRPRHKAKSGF